MLPHVIPMPVYDPDAFPAADTLARTLIESGTSDINSFLQRFGKGETPLQQSFGHQFATGIAEYTSTTIAKGGEAVFRKTIKHFVKGALWLPLDLYTHAVRTLALQLAAKSEEFSHKQYAFRCTGGEGYTLCVEAAGRIARLLGSSANFSEAFRDATHEALYTPPPVERLSFLRKHKEHPSPSGERSILLVLPQSLSPSPPRKRGFP